ncbi:hypothetical protein GJR96_04750 [Haloferax sp. MBLA0076]|uniref:Uncharacterized protein n=1 Tax=Haloferax litoreum TaxID=2666140 RepID=A0A6A8GDM8_9EURY|nr:MULTISPECIES: hypothetical protein [Haloferax]KAB1192785.1 hypothetical protein Hfx1148_04740 [Haloferax sp. CBA1148]MRX21268.1 hypothetical protein [Haloferax litoreum]
MSSKPTTHPAVLVKLDAIIGLLLVVSLLLALVAITLSGVLGVLGVLVIAVFGVVGWYSYLKNLDRYAS